MMSPHPPSSYNKGLCSRCRPLNLLIDVDSVAFGNLRDLLISQVDCDLCFLVFKLILKERGCFGLPGELELYSIELSQVKEWSRSWRVLEYDNNLLDVHGKDGPSFSGHANRAWSVLTMPELENDKYSYGYRITPVCQETWPRADQQFCQRLLQPDRVDFDRVREWHGLCCNVHTERCARPGWLNAQPAPTLLRVIDIKARTVVDAPDACCYTALSYVWGTSELRYVLKESDLLHLPHQLPSTLPQTIEDAIIVTHELGIEYLWVDMICIAQIPEVNKDKTHHIQRMASIFTFAEVTILAVACESADSGIEGVRHRKANNITRAINGVHLAVSQIQLDQDREGTRWSNRGWTFQESRFARRALAFGPNQAYWICQCDQWYESVLLEPIFPPRPGFIHKLLPDTSRPPERILNLCKYGFFSDKIEYDNHVLNAYVHLIVFYTLRVVGRPYDRVNAVSGMLNLLRSLDETRLQIFHHGLPEQYLDFALLWTPKSCLERPTFNGMEQKIPSWSWAGWSSQAGHGVWWDTSYYSYDYQILIAPALKWYVVAQDGSMRVIPEYPHSPQDWWECDRLDALRMPCGMHASTAQEEAPPAIIGLDIPNDAYFLRSLTTVSSNCFYLGERFQERLHPEQWIEGKPDPHVLTDKHGEILGFIRPPDRGSSMQNYGEPLDLIFMAYSSHFNDWTDPKYLDETCHVGRKVRDLVNNSKPGPWNIVDVMWIDRQHTGYVEGVSIGKVMRDAWLSAEPMTEWITLG